MRIVFACFFAFALSPLACATYREDLNRGQRMYEENQYEHALALWRGLERDADSLSPTDQVRYAYLRGMTDFRLGFRADARHWLAIARATDGTHPGGLRAEWQERLEQSLAELNRDFYGESPSPEAGIRSGIEYGRAPPAEPHPKAAPAGPSSDPIDVPARPSSDPIDAPAGPRSNPIDAPAGPSSDPVDAG